MNKRIHSKKSMVYFSRWSRKNYAVFSSIGKTIKVCSLGLTCALVTLPSKSKAQQNDTSTVAERISLQDVVVTAERTPSLLTQTAKIVTVLTLEDIARRPFVSIDQALNATGSIDVRQRGGLGVQSDVSIRGGNFEQTLVLLNGVNFNDPQTGHFNLNLPIDFNSIQRIELLYGSAARSFGPNAMSGVINIMVIPEKTNYVKLSAVAGDFSYYNNSTIINLKIRKTTNYFSLNRNASNGYIKNTDFEANNAYYMGTYDAKFGKFDYQAGINSRENGANCFYTPKYPNQFEANKTYLGSIKFENKGKFKISPTLYIRQNYDRFELYRGYTDATSWYLQHNYHKTNTLGANLNVWREWKLGKTTIGAEYRKEGIVSTVLGETLSTPIPISDGFNKSGNPLDYTNGHTREVYNCYFDHSFTYNKFSLSAGVMGNYNTDLKTMNYFPGVDLAYTFIPHWRLYSSANSSMRMPTYTDLYYTSSTLIGNTALKPEEAISYEVGFKLFYETLRGNISAFKRQGKNLIDWIKYPTDTKWRSENLTNIDFQGLEANISYSPSYRKKRASFINTLSLSYTFIESSKKEQSFLSIYVLDQLKNKFVGSVDFAIWKNIGWSVQGIYSDRYGSYQAYENGLPTKMIDFSPYWLVDSRIHWNSKKLNIFAEVVNIFNQKIVSIANVAQPGRWFKIGASYTIQFSKK
jgi:iron complex outermembrane receptor protein